MINEKEAANATATDSYCLWDAQGTR